MEWMLLGWRRAFDFSGRAQRKEYWMFVLGVALVSFILSLLLFSSLWAISGTYSDPGIHERETLVGSSALTIIPATLLGLFILATIIPTLSLYVRRFHDQELSGWMLLLLLVPGIGGTIVLVMMFIDGTVGPNRYGPDPKNRRYSVAPPRP